MESVKRALKWSGGMKIAWGGLILFLSRFASFYAIYCVVIGILLFSLSMKEDEELYNKRGLVLLLGTLGILSGFISSLLAIVAYAESKYYEIKVTKKADGKKKEAINPEVRKIDMLLKLGVGMVFISGILFATTSWAFISNGLKAIALIVFGSLFIGLSSFTEKKLKLEKTTYIYWILGMSFYFLTIVGILYFGMLGPKITYVGSLSSLAWMITWLALGILSSLTNLKFPKDYLLYTTYTSILFTIYYLLSSLGLEYIGRIMIISFLILIVNIYAKEGSKLKKFGYFVTLLSPFMILADFGSSYYYTASDYYIVLTCITNLISLYYYTITDKKEENDRIYLLEIYALFAIGAFHIKYFGDFSYLIVFVLATIHTLVIQMNWIQKEKKHQEFNFIIYSLIASISFMGTNESITSACFFTSVVYLLMTILLSTNSLKASSIKYTKYFQPISILAVVYSFFHLRDFPYEVSLNMVLIITLLIYCLMDYWLEKEEYKTIYFISIFIGMFVSMEANLVEKQILPALLLLIPGIYIFGRTHLTKEAQERMNILSFVSLLVVLYNALSIVNILNVTVWMSSIILIAFVLILILYLPKEEEKTIGYFAIVIPILDIVHSLALDSIFYKLSLSILFLYITFLVVKFICKEKETKNIWGVIGLIAAILLVFFESSSLIALYIGILGIGVIVIGYYSKILKSFFSLGIGITVANIIYQLWDLWGKIPFWLYLLIGGLFIIGFVTYKEMNKK